MNHPSVRDRYANDVQYKALVDMMEHMIHQSQFTPSEMREAAILASINYELHYVRRYCVPLTPELHAQLTNLDQLVSSHDPRTNNNSRG